MSLKLASRRVLNPDMIRGLNCWYDATTGLYNATSGGTAVTTNGGAIYRWEDQSGNGFHLTNAQSSPPTLVTNSLNGKPGVDFNGTNQILEDTTNQAGQLYQSGAMQLYVFGVFKFNTFDATTGSYVMARDGGYSVATAGRWRVMRIGSNYGASFQGNIHCMCHTNGNNEFGVLWTSLTPNYFAYSHPRTTTRGFTSSIFMNDSSVASGSYSDNGNPGAATLHRLAVGGRVSNTTYTAQEFCDCTIYEMAVYTRASGFFSQKEYNALSRYFRKKWNI
jgi:hypothetical protein